MSGSTTKAFELLFYLAQSDSEVSLARIASDIHWDKATALRYLGSLEEAGAVERRETGWTLGLAFVHLASRVPVSRIVASRAKPVLERLAAETGETVNLAVRSGYEAVYLSKAEGARALRPRCEPGDRLPFYCTSVGKATMSLLSDLELDAFRARTRLKAFTPTTIVDSEILRKEIDDVRRKGYAIDHGEYEAGLLCVAVPLEIVEAGFVGALSVSGPKTRMESHVMEAVRILRIAAIEIVTLVRERGVP